MITRLTLVASLVALFALSFASLVESTRSSHAFSSGEAGSCLDRGLVCPAR